MTPDLDAALRHFAAAFALSPNNLGSLTYRAPAPVESTIELGPVLTQYYARLDLRRAHVGGAFRCMIFGLEDVAGVQNGWHICIDKHGRTYEDPDWPASWVVIADRDGDAIVVDVATEDGVTFGSVQKHNRPLASSLAGFLDCLADCMAFEVSEFPDGAKDDDFNYLPGFLEGVERVVSARLSAEEREGFMYFFFG